ncbi:MAG: nucleotidyltransferase domain-containing protein [Candidatus Bathyarchaeia archaeon]
MSGFTDFARLEFKRRELSAERRLKLLEEVRRRILGVDDVVFAYVYGSFVEGSSFRDLDIAVWIRDPEKAFYYTVDFSAWLGIEVGVSVDVQVLNEAPLPFKHYVFTRGKLLLSRDEELRLRLADMTARHYADLRLLTETGVRGGEIYRRKGMSEV